jgi:hypothetical protein
MSTSRDELRAILETLDSPARDALRRVLIHGQADREAIASDLLRYGDDRGESWADVIDLLTMEPEAQRRVVRLPGEIRTS